MATRRRVVTLRVEYVDHDHGHWCRRCLLGTGLRFWIAVRSDYGMHLQTKLWCSECQGVDVAEVPDGRHC